MGRLSQSEIDNYYRDGYIVPGIRLSDEWLNRMRAAAQGLARNHPGVALDFVPSPHVPDYVPGVIEYEEWLKFASIPEILDAVGQLVGSDLLMWGSALFGKPGDGGKETP